MGQTSWWPIVGRSSPICAHCNEVKMRPQPMCRRNIEPSWKNQRKTNRRKPNRLKTNRTNRNRKQNRRRQRNERSFTQRADTGRRIFRDWPLCRIVGAPRGGRVRGAGALRRGRGTRSKAVQLFVAVRVRVFLHLVRRLFLLDDRPLRDRRGMDGGCSPSARKHCRAHRRARGFLYPDLPAPAPSLRMDEHSAGKRSEPRFEAWLSEFEFLCSARGVFPRVLHHRGAIVEKIFGKAG